MIEKDDMILVNGVAYTIAELEADHVLKAQAISWWSGRQAGRTETIAMIKLYEAEAQARRSLGGKKAAEGRRRKQDGDGGKNTRWHDEVVRLLQEKADLSARSIARTMIANHLAEQHEFETLRNYIGECRKALNLDRHA